MTDPRPKADVPKPELPSDSAELRIDLVPWHERGTIASSSGPVSFFERLWGWLARPFRNKSDQTTDTTKGHSA
jgi:hypothetical protein